MKLKKLLSVILAAILLISLFPAAVSASESPVSVTVSANEAGVFRLPYAFFDVSSNSPVTAPDGFTYPISNVTISGGDIGWGNESMQVGETTAYYWDSSNDPEAIRADLYWGDESGVCCDSIDLASVPYFTFQAKNECTLNFDLPTIDLPDGIELRVVNYEPLAQIDETPYFSLAEAKAAAQANDVITLIANAGEYTLEVGETMKVELNGFALDVKAAENGKIEEKTEGNVTTFLAVEASDDPSGVDLSMLTTGKKIILGTYASGDNQGKPVEWVIGGDGTEDCMSVPTGCIALVTSDVVVGGVTFGNDNVYLTSNVKTAVESAVTFTTDEQAAIQERTLQGTLDGLDKPSKGVAGNSVTAKVWAPTQTDASSLKMNSLTVSSDYWVCSPVSANDQYSVSYVSGDQIGVGESITKTHGVRAALYLDLSKVYGATAVEGKTDTYTLDLTAPSTFLTSFTLSKDYNDKYSTGNKTTAVNETVTYTITPISTGDDVPEFTNSTFTIDVDDGVGSAEVPLPETITKTGDYWYEIKETGGKTAGVTYDTNTYYLHLITDCKGGVFGVLSAQIHKTAPDLSKTDYDDQFVNVETDKIDTVSNSYGEGKLKITQDTTVDGAENDYDEFEVTVTFTLPTGTEIAGEITYGDQTIDPEDWENGSVTVTVDLKGGEYVEFIGIPDGTTYTVEQTGSNTDLGFGDPDYTVENGETDEDVVVTESDKETKVTGTISDGEDDITIANEMITPVDVGVILESGAFIILALGAIAFGVWLIVSKRRKSLDAE